MLFSIQSNGDLRPVDPQYIPHEPEHRVWRRGISDLDFGAATAAMNAIADQKEAFTTAWEVGENWPPVFEPIYHATGDDYEHAALFYGIIFWTVMAKHAGDWSFGRYELNAIPIKSMTYYRIFP